MIVARWRERESTKKGGCFVFTAGGRLAHRRVFLFCLFSQEIVHRRRRVVALACVCVCVNKRGAAGAPCKKQRGSSFYFPSKKTLSFSHLFAVAPPPFCVCAPRTRPATRPPTAQPLPPFSPWAASPTASSSWPSPPAAWWRCARWTGWPCPSTKGERKGGEGGRRGGGGGGGAGRAGRAARWGGAAPASFIHSRPLSPLPPFSAAPPARPNASWSARRRW